MKKIMMIAAMMVAAMSANAQNEVGQITLQPKVGMNISTLTSDDAAKAKVGLVAGLEAEYGVAENFGITLGALYSMQGAKVKNLDWKYNMDYINIPILAQYYPVKGLAIKAGVQFGFNVRAKISDGNNSISVKDFYDELGIDSDKKSFDFAIPVGLSYEYASFVLDARYNIGLSKAFKNFDDKNSVIQITLGYKFAL
jgi:hypothetical protein